MLEIKEFRCYEAKMEESTAELQQLDLLWLSGRELAAQARGVSKPLSMGSFLMEFSG